MEPAARATPWLLRNLVACAAFVVALVSIGLAVLPEHVVDPPARTVRQELKDLAKHVVTGEAAPVDHEYRTQLQRFKIAALVAALVAAGLAVIAVVRRENRTLAGAAIAAAAIALLWDYIVLGVVIVVIGALVIGLFSSS